MRALSTELTVALAEHARRHRVPGAALALAQGSEVSVVAHGIRDVRTQEPVEPTTRFEGGSLTKTLMAALAFRLAALGRLDLTATIAASVPELRGARWAADASLGDILSGRSGIPLNAETDFHAPFDGSDALDRMLQAIVEGASPRSIWSYSNASWSVMARAIEHATGIAWRQAMQLHVLGPAGGPVRHALGIPPIGMIGCSA